MEILLEFKTEKNFFWKIESNWSEFCVGGVGLTGIVGGKIGLENQSKLLERGGGIF